MKKLIWLTIAAAMLCTGCISGTSRLTADYNAANRSIYNDFFWIRDKRVPLPPGDWRIIASGVEQDFFKMYMLQELSERRFSYIYLSVDTAELKRESGYAPWNAMKRENMHFVSAISNTDGEPQDGWYINNDPGHFSGKQEGAVLEQATDYIRSRGYVISHDMIRVSHRVTGKHPHKSRYLYVNYFYNPEADGFPAEPKSSWSLSAWNAMQVNKDPRKIAYIDNLIDEHTVIHDKIVAGFHP